MTTFVDEINAWRRSARSSSVIDRDPLKMVLFRKLVVLLNHMTATKNVFYVLNLIHKDHHDTSIFYAGLPSFILAQVNAIRTIYIFFGRLQAKQQTCCTLDC